MSDNLNLDQFLDSLSQDGEYLQTSEFTLNSLKAREKLSQSQLPDSGLWLVKLVQAAVRSQAEHVSIKFGKRRVSVEFRNTRDLKAGALLQTVLSGILPNDPLLLHMVTGIRGSSTFSSESVSWQCGGQQATLNADGSKLEPVADDGLFTLSCTRPSRQRSFAKALATSVSQLAKETVEEHDALHSRCWPCPIPIYLDGKEVPRGYNVVKAGYVETSPWEVVIRHSNQRNKIPRAVMAVGGSPADADSLTLPYTGEVAPGRAPDLGKPVYIKGTFLSWPQTGNPCKAVVVMESEYHIDHCVDFVLDGVLVERRPIPLIYQKTKILGISLGKQADSLKLRVVVPIKPDELDLSQFAVRGRSLHPILRDNLPTIQSIAQALRDHRSEFWYVCVSPTYSKLLAGGFTMQTAVVALATKGIGLIPMGGVGAFVVASNTMLWRSSAYKSLENLEKALDEFLAESPAATP